MHLVSALTSGIRGAENGQASFFLRGTSTPTTVFRDFEGQDPVSSGDAVLLDSNGGVEIYVDVMTTVEVKDSAGAIVREFVAGYSSPGVEVRSQSFTGQAYDDGSGQTVTGTNQPTNLQSVLDKWKEINEGSDWKILDADGNEVSIGDALAGATGLFVNPRSSEYGAVGDGVNNDLPALDAATADAALIDGTIVLPHGIYRIVDTWVIPSNVNIFGLGATSVAVAIDNAANANAIEVSAPSSLDIFRTQFIEGFRIEAQQANTGIGIQLNDPTASMKDISVGSLNSLMTGHSIQLLGIAGSFVLMDDVRVDLHGTASELVSATDANWQGTLRATKCYFRYTSTAVVTSQGIQMHGGTVSECTFDTLGVGVGSDVQCIRTQGDDSVVAVQGCEFIAPTGDPEDVNCMWSTGLATGSFSETDNLYVGDFQDRGVFGLTSGLRVNNTTARRKSLPDVVSTGATVLTWDGSSFDRQYVSRQTTGNWSFSFDNDGNEGYVFTTVIKNESGGNINVTPEDGTNSFTFADGSVAVFQHIVVDAGGTVKWVPLNEPYEST